LPLLLTACSSGQSPGSGTPTAEGGQPCQTYWVTTGGSDTSGDGSAAAPFVTLERARQAVRVDADRGRCPIDVNIASGTYALTAALQFDAADSGSEEAPVTWRAAPDNVGPVVVSGGVPVAGFTCDADNLCTAAVAGLPAGIMPRQFYVNGERATRARTNVGMAVNPDYARVPEGYTQLVARTLRQPERVEAVTATQWKMMRCPVASVSGGLTLVMAQPCWDNANTYPEPWNFQLLSWLENAPEFVTEPGMWYLDPDSQELMYFNTSSASPQGAVLPVLESLVELVGTPAAPVTDIRFIGLQFSHATWLEPNSANGYVADQSGNILLGEGYTANVIGHQQVTYKTPGNITLRFARRITFDDNAFVHLGAAALDLDTGSQHNRIVNNLFTDISSAAIAVGGFTQQDMRPDRAHQTSDNLIANNTISHTGRDYYDAAAIFVGFTARTQITHNSISHTPWAGIAIGWGWGLFDEGGFPGLPHATPSQWGTYDTPTIQQGNEISSNLFDHFLEKLWDGGAIYTNGAQGQSYENGLVIKLNVARNKRPAAGGNIYYTDGGSRYITLEENVSIDNPVGTVDFGPCLAGSSFDTLCAATGLVPYGADMGGCLPVGDLTYNANYLPDTITFFGPQLCSNSNIPPYPVNLVFMNNVPITTEADVPTSILLQAGTQ
jgi:hypothetical protein